MLTLNVKPSLKLNVKQSLKLNIIDFEKSIEEYQKKYFCSDQQGHEGNRHWCFTSFEKDEKGELLLPEFDGKRVRYICWQQEKTKQGKLHLQGYVELKRENSSIRKVQEYLDLRTAHMEICRDVLACIAYTKKCASAIPETFVEHGKRKAQGSHDGNVVAIQTNVLNGGSTLDSYKIVGSSQFTAGADRVEAATMAAMSKLVKPTARLFKSQSEMRYQIQNARKIGAAIYIHRDKFNNKVTYNYQGEHIFVIDKAADIMGQEWRRLIEDETIWLPRKGKGDIPLCAVQVWYPLVDDVTGKKETDPNVPFYVGFTHKYDNK